MMKESGYQEKIALLKPWLVEIIDVVKRDLKNEHLKIDREFCRRYFLGKNSNQLQAEEMAAAYEKDIAAGNVGLGEFIATRWLLKHTDIYYFFEGRLKTAHPDFEKLEMLSMEESESIVAESLRKFGPIYTYIFAVFNSVVFPDAIYERLRVSALKRTDEVQSAVQEQEEREKAEGMKERHAREMAASVDRFEKKLSGMQKKYLNDVEALKRQISALQKKLVEKN